MSAKVTVTGGIAEPRMRYTQAGKSVLELSIAGTYSRKDKNTNQWEDVGSPLWLSTSFWEEEAERLADALSKGDRVSVEGILVLEEFQKRDGTPGQKLVLQSPRFLGVVPRRQANTSQPSYSPAPATNTGGYGGAPAGVQVYDPWAQQGAMDAPF